MQNSLRLEKIREKFKFRDTSLYLVVGMICVVLYAIVLPLFIAPDDLYHFDCSGYISDTVVDRNYISESTYAYPARIRQSIDDKSYMDDLFFTKIRTTNRENVSDSRTKLQKRGCEFWGHVVPAIGMKLGYLIYPSIGVMIVFSRLFAGVVYLLCLYFIIKKLKYGKKLFMAVSLTPTMLPLIASMNYDGLNFVVSAFFVMAVVNLTVENKSSFRSLGLVLVSAILLRLLAKTNMFLCLLFLLVIFYKFAIPVSFREKLVNLWQKRSFLWSLFLGIVIFSGFFVIGYAMRDTWLKIFNTAVYPNSVTLTSEILGGNLMFVPSLLLSHYWLIVIVILLVSDRSKILLQSKIWSFISVFLYFLNLACVLISFRKFSGHPVVSEIIDGQQGRYFTPYILLFAMVGASLKKRVKIVNWMQNSLIFVGAAVSTVLIIYIAYVYGDTRGNWLTL